MTCPNCHGAVIHTDDLGSFRCPECGLVHREDVAPRELPMEGEPSCPGCGSVLLHTRDIYGMVRATCFRCAYCGLTGILPDISAPVQDFARADCECIHQRDKDGEPVCSFDVYGFHPEEFLDQCTPIDPMHHCIRCVLYACRREAR